jgi:hypothetical protein
MESWLIRRRGGKPMDKTMCMGFRCQVHDLIARMRTRA